MKVIYGSCAGFHAIDVDSGNNYDIYIPVHVSCQTAVLWVMWNLQDLIPFLCLQQIQSQVMPHAIVFLPSSDGMEMLLCYEDEGVYVNTYGRIIKDVVLQWGEMPTSVGADRIPKQTLMLQLYKLEAACQSTHVTFCLAAHICSNQIMGWGEKAIEIRSVETGHLDGVFMHKRAQRLKFLCERNDKVREMQI